MLTLLILEFRRQPTASDHGLVKLGGFPCLRAKLDNLSALPPPRPFQRFPENRRHVKLDHLRPIYPLFSLRISVRSGSRCQRIGAIHIWVFSCVARSVLHNRNNSLWWEQCSPKTGSSTSPATPTVNAVASVGISNPQSVVVFITITQ